VASKALQDARRATRLAEAEARQFKTERDRLARENAVLSQRIERKIDSLEHSAGPAFHGTVSPTPVSIDFTNKNTKTKTRPADIIPNFDDLEDPFADGLVTGGMLTQLPRFNPNRLLDLLGQPRSLITPARAPIPTPEPPYPPFDPLTPEGRRRSAERIISSPAREKELAEERAYRAAIRAVELEFDETRNDQFALRCTMLRGNLNLPVRNIRAKLDQVAEEEEATLETEEKTEDEADDEKEDEGDESDDDSLGDEEFNVSFLDE
jgi:hypothetical protein